jgi:hypothetical protein
METSVQAFLASYPPEVRDLAWKLRALVFEVIPHVVEHVYASDEMIGYGSGSQHGRHHVRHRSLYLACDLDVWERERVA